MTINIDNRVTGFDLLTHSPDGESRAKLYRVGDLFPMDPSAHQRSQIGESATAARPWGMRYLRVPPLNAGSHEGSTSSYTTGSGDSDGNGPEDEGKD
ncbi:MAG: hypothetical protein ACRDNF_14560 [Streptosporangiaceae bacterium]